MCPCLVVAARRRGLSCPRLAVGRILRPPRPCVAAPARALCARPLRPCRLGGGVVGCPARPVARLLPRLPPLLRRGVGFLVAVLVWGCAVSVSAFAPLPSSVVRSARASFAPWAGCALGVSFRPSVRAVSGFVAVVRFSSLAAAGRFARSWGVRLPSVCRGCCVRPVPGGFAVSVPVAPACPVGRGRASRSLALRFAASCPVGA